MSLNKEDALKKGNNSTKTAIILALFVILMVGMAYAAVPLYEAFCRATGFGGTTQRVDKSSNIILDRIIKVQFDANVANNLPWIFEPVLQDIDVKIGETKLVFYNAKNLSVKNVKGRAVFNVTPDVAGQYFNKIECFCFTEQLLNPYQQTDMPIEFYIDPDFADDPDLKNVNVITLSYTFYPFKE